MVTFKLQSSIESVIFKRVSCAPYACMNLFQNFKDSSKPCDDNVVLFTVLCKFRC